MRKPSFKYLLLSSFFVSSLSFNALAVTDGGVSIKYLSQIYATIKKEVEEMKKLVDEARATSDSLQAMKGTINDVREEYQFVRDFDPDYEVKRLKNWAGGITDLDELGNAKGFEEKWRILNNEINQRIKKSKDVPDKLNDASVQLMQQMLDQMKENEALLKTYRSAALKNNKKDTVADLQKLMASSSALTASLLLEEKQARLELERQRKEKLLSEVGWDYQFMKFLNGKEE